jgi:mitochondrial fission protein ELM1
VSRPTMAAEQAAATQYITTNDGIRLAYERAGTAGPVVVLIHGWSGSRKYFCHNIAALAEHCQVCSNKTCLVHQNRQWEHIVMLGV